MTDDGSPWRRGARHEPVVEVGLEPNRGTTRAQPAAGDPIVISTEPDAVTEPPPPDDAGRPQWVPAAVVGCVLALVIVGALVFGGGDTDEPEETSTTTPTETMPTPTTVLDEQTNDDPEDDPGGDPDEPADRANSGGSSAGDAERSRGGANGTLPIRVDLPPVLAQQTTPTEIVALTPDGRLVTVSIPSGTVRVEQVADAPARVPQFASFDSFLVVTPTAAAVRVRTDALTIIGREGPTREVPLDDFASFGQPSEVFPVGWLQGVAGAESFVVLSTDFQGNEEAGFVRSDGSVELIDADEAGELRRAVLTTRVADGIGYFGAGGQVFRYGADGEISIVGPGELVTTTNIGPLIRRCDETNSCTAEIVRSDGTATVDPGLADRLGSGFDQPDFSPDGHAVATVTFEQNGIVLVLTPLDETVEPRRMPIGGFPHRTTGWVADGAGVVMPAFATAGSNQNGAIDDGIRFVPLDPEADVVTFAQEIGPVAVLDTRFPDEELPAPTRSTTASFDRSDGATRLPTVVAADRSGSIYRIDFAVGEATRIRTGLTGAWTNGRSAQIIPMGESVVIIDHNGADGLELLPRDETKPAPGWPKGFRYALDATRAWVPVTADDGVTDYRPVARDGTITERAIAVPEPEVIGADGAGGLLHEFAGDIWLTSETTTQRITTGDLLALNGEQMIVSECDASRTCEVVRVLPRTDTRRTLETTSVGTFASGATVGRGVSLEGTLSPDGRTAFVELDPGRGPDPAAQWAFVDIQGDTLVPTDMPADGQPIIWSSDSTTALFVADGELRVFDRTAGTIEALDGFGFVAGLGEVP